MAELCQSIKLDCPLYSSIRNLRNEHVNLHVFLWKYRLCLSAGLYELYVFIHLYVPIPTYSTTGLHCWIELGFCALNKVKETPSGIPLLRPYCIRQYFVRIFILFDVFHAPTMYNVLYCTSTQNRETLLLCYNQYFKIVDNMHYKLKWS